MGVCGAALLGALAFFGIPLAAQQPIGELFASDANVQGAFQLVKGGTLVMPGSQLTAGEGTALLKLTRGGTIRICPRTSISINMSKSGEMMIGINTGAIESQHLVGGSGDSVMTPDFRILFGGPAFLHAAIGTDSRGNTCVKSTDGNSPITVTELMGTDTFQVGSGTSIIFHEGKISGAEANAASCGCPAQRPEQTVQTATTAPKSKTQDQDSSDGHVQMEAPFVYRGAESGGQSTVIANLKVNGMSNQSIKLAPEGQITTMNTYVQAAEKPQTSQTSASQAQQRGFFRRIRHFFGRMFR